jgi:hypothetical protein
MSPGCQFHFRDTESHFRSDSTERDPGFCTILLNTLGLSSVGGMRLFSAKKGRGCFIRNSRAISEGPDFVDSAAG